MSEKNSMQKSWNKKPNTHSLMPNDKEMAFEMKAKQAEDKKPNNNGNRKQNHCRKK